MHKISILKKFYLSAAIIGLSSGVQKANAVVPRPDHVVICILENHGFSQIIGSSSAPYINSLVPQSAHLLEYYGMTHPSQPNYIMLFSGDNQGETTDNLPHGTPWTTPNLGASLISTGYTFGSFSEDLPAPGSTVASSGAYARKHCPWVNWQGTGTNQIPATCNLSVDDFPTDFSHLPDLSFVIPNQNNDMHNGSDPGKITNGDAWVEQYLRAYVDWAQTHNSLFILTFDEDNFTATNHIPCLVVGPMVQPGDYYLNGYNHYDMLRTLEDMFNLPHAGNAANAHSIEEIWLQPASVGINENPSATNVSCSVYPNPINDNSQLVVTNQNKNTNSEVHLVIYDIEGREKSDEVISLLPGKNSYSFRKENLSSGIYTYQLKNEQNIFGTGKVVVD